MPRPSKPASVDAPSAAPSRRPGGGAVTIHDVARLAEVSLMTVSRALKQPEKVSPQTLQRVRDAVSRTGYVPNLMAGGLRSARSGVVAVLVPTLAGLHFAGMIQSLTQALGRRDLQVLVGQLGYREQREDELLRAVVGRRPDAIVITGVVHSPQGRALLLGSGIPIVETWDCTEDPLDMLVGASHQAMGAEVCEFLARRGRRHLAMVAGDDERSVRRTRAFVEHAAARGLPPPVVRVTTAPTNHAGGREALQALLLRHPAIDGLWCGSDMLAMGVLTQARVRGIDVPGALAVVGSGDLDFAATLVPSLTTVRIDGERVGALAAQLLLQRLDGQDVAQKVMDVGFTLIERESA